MAATRIGIDTGGTFTDIAVLAGDGLHIHKLASSPSNPAKAVLAGLEAMRLAAAVDVVHGTTVGLNAVLTGRVARTAFVTNQGFKDLIEIGRQERSDLYDLAAPRPSLPVPRSLRFCVASRRAADGRRLLRPPRTELEGLLSRLRRARVGAVAIGLLHAYASPEDEREIARALSPLGVPITCSAELLPVHGEYERFAAAILNAAITPIMGAYLERLGRGIAPGRLRLMRSSAGIMPAEEAARFPARAVFSGPAGGVLAARQLAAELELGRVATLDMGGTSTDVSLVQPITTQAESMRLAGLPLALPAVDLHTIGCGGGSIAHADAGGALRVGPRSAGADPGPACYGRGEEPTVTDAHMVLGHMGADSLLGGSFPVEPERSLRAVEGLAQSLGLNLRRAAEGILEVAEVEMMRALLVITVERAIDPATVPLLAFGGAGGLHAARLADRLSMPCAIVAPDPGAFSAVGLALAGESQELSQPILRDLHSMPASERKALGRELARRARAAVRACGPGPRISCRVEAMLRFRGQGPCLGVPLQPALEAAFCRAHQELHGFVPGIDEIELVELRARAERQGPPLPRCRPRTGHRPSATLPPRHPPCGGHAWRRYRRLDLAPGSRLEGPCLIEEQTGVTVVPGHHTCRVRKRALWIAPCP